MAKLAIGFAQVRLPEQSSAVHTTSIALLMVLLVAALAIAAAAMTVALAAGAAMQVLQRALQAAAFD
jgi:hypothetical protein